MQHMGVEIVTEKPLWKDCLVMVSVKVSVGFNAQEDVHVESHETQEGLRLCFNYFPVSLKIPWLDHG